MRRDGSRGDRREARFSSHLSSGARAQLAAASVRLRASVWQSAGPVVVAHFHGEPFEPRL